MHIPATLGARFYNLPEKEAWFKRNEIILTAEQVPSVTTTLEVWPKGKHFMEWLASRMSYEESLEERDRGGERGTRVHNTIESLVYGDTITFQAYADRHFNGELELAIHEWRMVEAFEDWYSEWGMPQIVKRRNGRPSIESTLYSWQHRYAGTSDAVYTGGRFGNKKIMVDYKTGKDIYDSFWAQLAAYYYAWDEMDEVELDGIAVFRPNNKRKCGYDFEIIEDPKVIQEWFIDYLGCYRLWVRHRKSQKLAVDERKVHEVREAVRVGKLATRPISEAPAWAAPKIIEDARVPDGVVIAADLNTGDHAIVDTRKKKPKAQLPPVIGKEVASPPAPRPQPSLTPSQLFASLKKP